MNLTILVNTVRDKLNLQPLETNTSEGVDFTIDVNARFPTPLARALLLKLVRLNGPTLVLNIRSLAGSGVLMRRY